MSLTSESVKPASGLRKYLASLYSMYGIDLNAKTAGCASSDTCRIGRSPVSKHKLWIIAGDRKESLREHGNQNIGRAFKREQYGILITGRHDRNKPSFESPNGIKPYKQLPGFQPAVQ
ncbi:uncharacterized protein RAG0_12509 [Rhynchosporium agropyri]|uniref:Uncharacterized protein n=1 Tax=Rhynchosporium agropyri TaxID=914238 RepID=A0A1E1L8S4_9HELO|nr:uncharacterized protein RAG0_12509 [Rhynchosporium agropyri]